MVTLNARQLADYDYLAGFRGTYLRDIIAIQLRESGGNPEALNNSAYPDLPGFHSPVPGASEEYSAGISQINALAHFPSSGFASFGEYARKLFDPLFNAQQAYGLSGGVDLSPWKTIATGDYKDAGYYSHLPDAIEAANAAMHTPPTGVPDTGSNPLDVIDIPNPLNPLGDAAGGIKNLAETATTGVKALIDPRTWWRLAFLIGGVLLIGAGILLLNSRNIAGIERRVSNATAVAAAAG